MIRRMKHLRPAHELRQRFNYNNQVGKSLAIRRPENTEAQCKMFVTAAHIISKYSGMPFASFLAQRIFAPLNMSSTTITPSRAENYMTHAWMADSRRIPLWFTDENIGLIDGAGGIASTAVDMVYPFILIVSTCIVHDDAIVTGEMDRAPPKRGCQPAHE